MLSKRMKGFLVVAFGVLVWVGFGADESVAGLEPAYTLSPEEYSENRELYDGEVIMTDGRITSMAYTDTGMSVVIDGEVNCYFRGEEADDACKLHVGDYTSLKGRGNGNSGYTTLAELNYCALD